MHIYIHTCRKPFHAVSCTLHRPCTAARCAYHRPPPPDYLPNSGLRPAEAAPSHKVRGAPFRRVGTQRGVVLWLICWYRAWPPGAHRSSRCCFRSHSHSLLIVAVLVQVLTHLALCKLASWAGQSYGTSDSTLPHAHIHIYISTYLHVYVCTFLHLYIYTYIPLYIYT